MAGDNGNTSSTSGRGEMLEGIHGIQNSMQNNFSIMAKEYKSVQVLIEGLMKLLALLQTRLDNVEMDVDSFRGPIKNFEELSVFRSRDFIDKHIANIVKPSEERLVNKIMHIEDELNLVRNLHVGPNFSEFRSKGKVKFSPGGGRRGGSIIIERAPDDLAPLEILNELACVLEIPDFSNIKISHVKRWTSGVGTDEERVLMRVSFENVYDTNKFLNKDKNKKLKDTECSDRFHGVKIYLDRTYAQREHFKILLNEAKRRNVVLHEGGNHEYIWIVSRGKVMKVRNRGFGRHVI